MARVSACPRTPSSPRPTVVFCTGAGCRKILDLPLHHSGYASCIHCGVEVSESSTNKQHTLSLGSKTRTILDDVQECWCRGRRLGDLGGQGMFDFDYLPTVTARSLLQLASTVDPTRRTMCRMKALLPHSSSSSPKTPYRSYSAQIRSQNEEKNPPPKLYLPLQTRT